MSTGTETSRERREDRRPQLQSLRVLWPNHGLSHSQFDLVSNLTTWSLQGFLTPDLSLTSHAESQGKNKYYHIRE